MTILDLGGWDGRLLHQILNTAGVSAGRLIVVNIIAYAETASRVDGFETVVLNEDDPLPFGD